MRTKLTILGLIVFIGATVALNVRPSEEAGLISVSPPSREEVFVPAHSAPLPHPSRAHVRTSEGVAVPLTVPEGPFITLVAGEKTYRLAATSTQTIFAVMEKLQATTAFSFQGTEFPGLGFFVEEIDHQKSRGGSYWMLYVNMRAAEKGVSQTLVSPGDQILWRYE